MVRRAAPVTGKMIGAVHPAGEQHSLDKALSSSTGFRIKDHRPFVMKFRNTRIRPLQRQQHTSLLADTFRHNTGGQELRGESESQSLKPMNFAAFEAVLRGFARTAVRFAEPVLSVANNFSHGFSCF